ncbi:MAG: carboxylesterase/lipase family protein [Acidobacteria bacterium]|nr:carboxylesterase/lipase family protein [Acidobacteriota bacterium]
MFLRDAAIAAGGLAAAYSISGLSSVAASVPAAPVVETIYGKVRGFLNDGICTFRGIRYGASTAGKNRFMSPRKPEPWAEIRDATSYGYSAPQTNPAARGVDLPESEIGRILAASDGYRVPPAESEDCLFLNVWTPGIGTARKRPVMVWLHGGGYSSGSASSLLYDGTNLARRGDIVMVGVNHRLNVFGYTHLGDFGMPEYADSGNAGQKDIIAALEWVRDNIERFGGDPGRVMIFGESGGGGKVSMLLASPPAKGLFHSAVIESGPGIRMSERAAATRVAEIFLAELGLDPKRLPELQKLSTEKIQAGYYAATATLAKQGRSGGGLGGGSFSPVLDPVVLPAHPFHPAATRISEDVPVMIGWNKTESTAFMLADKEAFSLDEAGLRKRVEALAGSEAEALINMYRSEYPKMSPSTIFFHISSYSMMGYGSVTIAERKAALGRAPAYLYRLDWETPVMGGKLISPHGLEMPLVFDNVENGGEALTGGGIEAGKLAAKMSEVWISFAGTRNPNTKKSGLARWDPYDSGKRTMMIFDNQSRIEQDFQKEQRIIFERINRAKENL